MFSRWKVQKRALRAQSTALDSAPETVHVLLVGADAHAVGIVELLRRHTQVNFDVLSVGTPEESLEALARHRPDILLLYDSLPSEARLNLVRHLASTGDSPPIILLLGQGAEEVATEALECGARHCVRKDSTDYLALGRTIHHVLVTHHLQEEQKQLRDDLERLTTVDSLTGLPNRRHVESQLESECRRARRYGTTMSFIVLGVDDLERCIDLYGHRAADDIIRDVATLLSKSVRSTDILARYGGDEFCVLLPETGREGAMQLAERLRFAVAAARLVPGELSEAVTVSVGVFTPTREQDLQLDVVVNRARLALKEARSSGKNRVCAVSSRGEAAKARETFRRPWGPTEGGSDAIGEKARPGLPPGHVPPSKG